jgi:uncharacterized protein (TIGR02001 family)
MFSVLAGLAVAAAASACAEPEGDAAAPAEPPARVRFSANLAVVSDYKSRGLSYSAGAAAIQGGFDIAERSGWSAGLWASTIDEWKGSTVEIDLYAARSFSFGATEMSLGATAFVFPDGADANIGEVEASIARSVGPIDANFSIGYAWEQANLGDGDNLYVSLNGTTPLGRFAGVPLAMSGSVGYEDGPFAIEGTKIDSTLGLTADVEGVAFGVSYVYTNIEHVLGEPTWVFSIAHTF